MPPVAPLPLALVTLVLAAGSVAVAPPAAALCAAVTLEDFVADADSLVLAEVARSDDDRADLVVEEVWSGPDRPERLTVVTGQLREGVSSSADIRLREGWHYLVDVLDEAPPRTHACAVRAVDVGGLAAVRPAGSRAPVVEDAGVVDAGRDPDVPPAGEAGVVPPVAAVVGAGAVALAVVGAGAAVLLRRGGARRG